MKTLDPLKAIRANCLDCSGSRKAVAYCHCDGAHATRCHLWPYRFGMRETTAAKKYGEHAVTPGALPGPDVEIEDLPNNIRDLKGVDE